MALHGIENLQGRPVYVHAKVCVVDDTWASVGFDNFNRRSWTHDSELSATVYHADYARDLRTALASEHLGAGPESLLKGATFATLAASAGALQAWHERARAGPRPPGRLRPLAERALGAFTRAWPTRSTGWSTTPTDAPSDYADATGCDPPGHRTRPQPGGHTAPDNDSWRPSTTAGPKSPGPRSVPAAGFAIRGGGAPD